jgi:hypothetical protein
MLENNRAKADEAMSSSSVMGSSDTRITSMKVHAPAALALFELSRRKEAAEVGNRSRGSNLGLACFYD